jgi:hypothetical protein
MSSSGHVNQSGFPLQIALADRVRQTTTQHGWQELYTEHAWKHPTEPAQGFLDLALVDRHQTGVLTIECKRVVNAAWTFFHPGRRTDVRHLSAWLKYKPLPTSPAVVFDWRSVRGNPGSPQAGFCVVPGQGASDKPMLERVAAELLLATEALAHEERALLEKSDFDTHLRYYISAVVTTARLELCLFDPEKISMADGSLPPDASYEVVPYVRFRKQLSTRALTEPANSRWNPLPGLGRRKERTIFVVNAESFVSFLSKLSVDDGSLVDVVR